MIYLASKRVLLPAIDLVTKIGAESSLAFCLDAGDGSSYGGSGQTWADVSGNGYDFTLGETSGSEATDPTFTGSAGDLGSYFSFDGGDYFRRTPIGTAVNAAHKDNAAFSFVLLCYVPDHSAVQYLIGDADNTADVGFYVSINTSGTITFAVANGSGTVASHSTGGASITGTWQVVGISIDEAAGTDGSFFYSSNIGFANFDGTYSSPSASDANEDELIVGGRPAASNSLVSGSRYAVAIGWSRNISRSEMTKIANGLRHRYPN